MKTAIIAGASGLVGKECLYRLLESAYYERVIALVRTTLPIKHPKLIQHQTDFDAPGSLNGIKGDDIFCCLGSTMKKAGSEAAFRKVDYAYPVALAEHGLTNGAGRFFLISAAGASAHSPIFYNKVKGEVEDRIAGMGYTAFHVFRPSILLGHRAESRPAEWIGKHLMGALGILFVGPLKAYKAIKASDVAEAMVKAATSEAQGVVVHGNGEMLRS